MISFKRYKQRMPNEDWSNRVATRRRRYIHDEEEGVSRFSSSYKVINAKFDTYT
jgi:hypothetical protein